MYKSQRCQNYVSSNVNISAPLEFLRGVAPMWELRRALVVVVLLLNPPSEHQNNFSLIFLVVYLCQSLISIQNVRHHYTCLTKSRFCDSSLPSFQAPDTSSHPYILHFVSFPLLWSIVLLTTFILSNNLLPLSLSHYM